jgi:YgiT-type zinc finger domain-containing protein
MVEIPCDVCHIGLMQPRRVTYATRLGDQLLMLPDIHVSICDVCGEAQYDPETMARIEMLLGVDIGSAAQSHRLESAGEKPDISFQLSQRRRSA